MRTTHWSKLLIRSRFISFKWQIIASILQKKGDVSFCVDFVTQMTPMRYSNSMKNTWSFFQLKIIRKVVHATCYYSICPLNIKFVLFHLNLQHYWPAHWGHIKKLAAMPNTLRWAVHVARAYQSKSLNMETLSKVCILYMYIRISHCAHFVSIAIFSPPTTCLYLRYLNDAVGHLTTLTTLKFTHNLPTKVFNSNSVTKNKLKRTF